jgi:hypothetical protein
MNLICFPHYTCGGLLCDIMEDVMSEFADNGGIANPAHNVGKIGDSLDVFTDYDVDEFLSRVEPWMESSRWIGTHCWPGPLPLERFETVVNITTTTYASKIYRWYRAYVQYHQPMWSHLTGTDLVDKIVTVAKSYVIPSLPVSAPNVFNLEFADLVHQTEEFDQVLDRGRVPRNGAAQHMQRWMKQNEFLYNTDIWNSVAARSFFHAEFEINLGRGYQWGNAKHYNI